MHNFGACLVRLGGTLTTLRRQHDAALESNNRALLQTRATRRVPTC